MSAADFACDDLSDFTKSAMLKALESELPLGEIKLSEGYEKPKMLVPGYAEGEIIGGNLSLIVSTLRTPYEIGYPGKDTDD